MDALLAIRIAVTALTVLAVLLVLPRRQRAWSPVLALLLLSGVHVAILWSPPGLATGGLWALSCLLTLGLLAGPEAAPARRLAVPFLSLAAILGLIGQCVDEQLGRWLLLGAVACRLGVFPFHSWAVGAYTLAPTTLAVAAVAPMHGLALLARVSWEVPGPLAALLVLSAFLAAGLAVVQTELGRAAGFLTVSVEAVVLLGVLDPDPIGHLGGMLMWAASGLGLLGMGLVVAALRSRRGRVPVDRHLGLLSQAPTFAGLFFLFGLASIGAPGTADFVSGELVLHGSLAHRPALLLGLIGAISLQGYAMMHLFYRVFLGPPDGQALADVLGRERLALVPLAALLLLTGLAPQLLLGG